MRETRQNDSNHAVRGSLKTCPGTLKAIVAFSALDKIAVAKSLHGLL
jgi:hypothetical protein